MKRFIVILICFTMAAVSAAEARRVREPRSQFFRGEPTKQLTIGVDFAGTIAFKIEQDQWQVREGMLDFLRELKARGHKLILVTGSMYGKCIEAVPEIQEIFDSYIWKGSVTDMNEFDFVIDDDAMSMDSYRMTADIRGESPDKYIAIPDPLSYDYKNNPLGWADKIVELIQKAGG